MFSGVESLAKTIGRRCATCCAYFLKCLCIFRPARATCGRDRKMHKRCKTYAQHVAQRNVDQSFSQRIPPQKVIKITQIYPHANVYMLEHLKQSPLGIRWSLREIIYMGVILCGRSGALGIFVGKTRFRINFNSNLIIFGLQNDVPNLFDKNVHQKSILPFREPGSTDHKMVQSSNKFCTSL